MKSALVIPFNQDFTQNVPKLDTLYRGRFSEIRYLAPDHCRASGPCTTKAG